MVNTRECKRQIVPLWTCKSTLPVHMHASHARKLPSCEHDLTNPWSQAQSTGLWDFEEMEMGMEVEDRRRFDSHGLHIAL